MTHEYPFIIKDACLDSKTESDHLNFSKSNIEKLILEMRTKISHPSKFKNGTIPFYQALLFFLDHCNAM